MAINPKDYVGCIVRYKSWNPKLGTVARDYDFLVESTQVIFNGSTALRGVAVNRKTGKKLSDTDVGRPLVIDEIRIVKQKPQEEDRSTPFVLL